MSDYDFYTPEKPTKSTDTSTSIAGNVLYSGMRFTIDGLLFEVTAKDRIQCVDTIEKIENSGRDYLKNTVFCISGLNHEAFFEITGFSPSQVKKLYAKRNDGNKAEKDEIIKILKKSQKLFAE